MPYRFIIGHKIPPAGPTYVVEAGPLSTPCWIWQRALTNRGYGSVHRGGRSIAAHVLVYEEQRGPVPAGLELDHLCRNHACVNPGHLEAVSRAVNVQRGVKAKLTAAQVAEIRAKRAVHYKQLMREYGVSASAIHYIWSNKSWKP